MCARLCPASSARAGLGGQAPGGGGAGGDMNEAFIQKPEPPPPRFSEGCTDTETGSGAMNGALISHVDPVYNPF